MKINKDTFLEETKRILETQKIITQRIKEKLISIGFKEVIIGCKKEHEINSKDIKFDFHGYNIAIGISCRPISYASGRQYRALVFNFRKKKK